MNSLEPVSKISFTLEKEIQLLVENNLEVLFNLQLVKSEFSIGNFRFDTLCYDEENNCFVILEYKKGSSYSVIDQGYSYLSIMLNNKAEFILEYNETMNNNLKRDEVDWSQSRIVFISPAFNNYQKNSINFKDVPFELWEIKKFENDLIGLKKYTPTSKERIDIIKSQDSNISNVSKEIVSYKEADHTSKCSPKCLKVWFGLKEQLEDLSDTRLDSKQQNINAKVNGKVVCHINFRKNYLLVELSRGNKKPDGSYSQNYFTVDDPKKKCIAKSFTWKNGVQGHYYNCKFESLDQLAYVMFLIKQKYDSLV